MSSSSTEFSSLHGPVLCVSSSPTRRLCVGALTFILSSGPVYLYWGGHHLLAIALAGTLLIVVGGQLSQTWLGASLAYREGRWWWQAGPDARPVEVAIDRSVMGAGLATSLLLRDTQSQCRWWLNIFHDSLEPQLLCALRRRLVIAG